MKVRDSGMPDEVYWESLFDPPLILDRLRIDGSLGDVVEVGCGYGTFSLPVARRIAGTLLALDIEPAMVQRTAGRAAADGLTNVDAALRDVLAGGLGVPDGSQSAVLLFNLLHSEYPVALLRLAARALRPGGRVLAIHWRPDPATPRGPALDIRPRPGQIARWGREAGLVPDPAMPSPVDLPPWHYGVSLTPGD